MRDIEPTDSLIRLPSLIGLVGLGRSQIYLLISQNAFPRPVKIGRRAVAWKLSEINGWINSRPRSDAVEAA